MAEALTLASESTAVGLMELMMIHENLSPYLEGWNKEDALRAMRLMRQVIENRCRHPKLFGVKYAKPGLTAELLIMKVRSQFAASADAPNFPHKFIGPARIIIAAANDSSARGHGDCHDQVQSAITAATEAGPPADCIKPNLYYWRTKDHAGPGPHTHPDETLQNNTFYTQDNIPER